MTLNKVTTLVVLVIIAIYSFYFALKKESNEVKSERVVTGQVDHRFAEYAVKYFYKSEGYAGQKISPRDVTLVTHCTTDKLHHVINLVESWDGPISVSVLSSGDDAAFADDAIDGLRACWPDIRSRTSFHLVYVNRPSHHANFTALGSFTYNSCKDVMRKLFKRLSKLSNDNSSLQYLHNIMRNIALRGALTEFVMVIDVDLIPSQSLRPMFIKFANKNNLFEPFLPESFTNTQLHPIEDVIFILPVFEYKQYLGKERTKSDLLRAISERKAKSLFKDICQTCHQNTDYNRWLQSRDNLSDEISVAYDVNYAPLWEPFFISKRINTEFSEPFTKYGHDRLIQLCEMKWRNTKFSILNNAFLIREGFSFKNQIEARKSARTSPQQLHEDFQKEMRNVGLSEIKVQSC